MRAEGGLRVTTGTSPNFKPTPQSELPTIHIPPLPTLFGGTMKDSWDVCLEDAFDVCEMLDEMAEDRGYPEVVREELQLIYKSLIYIRDRIGEVSE